MSPGRVQLARRALQDLRKLQPRDRVLITTGLRDLEAGTENLDIKPLTGIAPWPRMRVGDWRVLSRPARGHEVDDGTGYIVARIVNRRDLQRIARARG